MDRPITYTQEQLRAFDFASGWTWSMIALAAQMQDDLGGPSVPTVVGGTAATPTGPTSLTINLAAGRIYQIASVDAVAIGNFAQNTTQVLQQGQYAGGQITLSTSGIAAGQSRWALVQAQFSQADNIAPSDPTSGLLAYYNMTNPTQPFQGPNNNGLPQPTARQGEMVIAVITGAAATTGSEVPPTPTSGWVPLYLIDLAFGQTAISSGQILVSGPSVGTNVPSNYPYAPFLAGLLNSHHNGTPGQAPKINLATETQGILPSGQLPSGIFPATTDIVSTNQSVGASNSNYFYIATAGINATIAQTSTLGTNWSAKFFAYGGSIALAINSGDNINGGTTGAGFTIPQGWVGHLTTNNTGTLYLDIMPATEALVLGTTSFGSTGYAKLAGGLILQWGVTPTVGGSSSFGVTFPIAFPTNAYFAINIALVGDTGADANNVTNSLSATAFGSFNHQVNSTAYYWMALGN